MKINILHLDVKYKIHKLKKLLFLIFISILLNFLMYRTYIFRIINAYNS